MPEHIKVPDVSPIVRYAANGTQTEFAYPFPIFASEDLAIFLDGAKQSSGFTISGAGNTSGGNVTFDTAPASDTVVTLARELPIERVTDFLEGGDFSAVSINNELDYLIAALQQVNRENDLMLRYSDHETPANVELPSVAQRANKGLGFDGSGNPVALDLSGATAPADFTATGTGAAKALDQVDEALKAGAISAENLQEANRHIENLAHLKSEELRASLAEVNQTIRAEIASEDKFVRRMRPTFGYLMALTWAAQMLGVAYVIIFDTQRAASVLTAMASLSAIWGIGLSVLGIYVYKRSEDKKLLNSSHETIIWND